MVLRYAIANCFHMGRDGIVCSLFSLQERIQLEASEHGNNKLVGSPLVYDRTRARSQDRHTQAHLSLLLSGLHKLGTPIQRKRGMEAM